MPQDAAGQADPDPPAPESPPPPRRWRVRWYLLALLTLTLGLGVSGWFRPSDAWLLARSAIVGSVVGIVMERNQGDIPERARPREIALAIGYVVLAGVAGPIGAWLAR